MASRLKCIGCSRTATRTWPSSGGKGPQEPICGSRDCEAYATETIISTDVDGLGPRESQGGPAEEYYSYTGSYTGSGSGYDDFPQPGGTVDLYPAPTQTMAAMNGPLATGPKGRRRSRSREAGPPPPPEMFIVAENMNNEIVVDADDNPISKHIRVIKTETETGDIVNPTMFLQEVFGGTSKYKVVQDVSDIGESLFRVDAGGENERVQEHIHHWREYPAAPPAWLYPQYVDGFADERMPEFQPKIRRMEDFLIMWQYKLPADPQYYQRYVRRGRDLNGLSLAEKEQETRGIKYYTDKEHDTWPDVPKPDVLGRYTVPADLRPRS